MDGSSFTLAGKGGAGGTYNGSSTGGAGGDGGYCTKDINIHLTSLETVSITIGNSGSGGAGGSNGMIESESGESGGLSQVGNFIIHSPSPGSGGVNNIGENAYGCLSDTIIKYSNEGTVDSDIKGGTAAFCSKEIYNTELSGNIEIVIGAGGKGGAGYIEDNGTLTAGGNGEDGYVLIEPI